MDGDRVEISLWFYNTRVKIGRGNLKVPRKPLIGPAHANARKMSFVWANVGLLESESRNEIYRKGVG